MHSKSVGIVVVTLVLVVGMVTPVAGATRQETVERGVGVQFHEDGSARMAVTVTFDLDDANESDAFEQLRTDETTREQFRRAFLRGMQVVANDTEATTGREMRVHNATLDVRTVGDTGVVEQSVTWEGLAAVEDESLTVTEPFASGFAPDRPFRLVAPDGYTVASATPGPDEERDGRLTWDAGTSLDGFTVTLEAPPETTTTDERTTTTSETTAGSPSGTTSGSGPGFGIAAALAGLLAVAALARRSGSDR